MLFTFFLVIVNTGALQRFSQRTFFVTANVVSGTRASVLPAKTLFLFVCFAMTEMWQAEVAAFLATGEL
uniref:Uncharacterized protein n=1 Tax=Anguilla anguilla TaxID=7936 RepID=A0A0E9WRD0_ANGAN